MALTAAQKGFATSKAFAPAFVGGFGSGKTLAAMARILALKFHSRQCDVGYYLPNYQLVQDIALKRLPEFCDANEWRCKVRGGASPQIEFPNAGKILLRSMSNPDAIVGFEVAHSVCDELDTLKTEDARAVWNKIIARNRQKCGMPNTVGVATTPEGFRFVWERWVKNPAPGYEIFRAKTMDNAANLPAGYIDNLRGSYSTNLLAAYLDGEFVNLTAGSVYAEFDRALNATDETVKDKEPLHIGMDFNVAHGAAVVHVLRGDDPHAVHEYTGVFDTPAMIGLIKRDFKDHAILIYPDASGNNRKSNNASESDLSLLKAAGFRVCVNPANPAVKDRVLAFNAMINKDCVRRYRVNPEKCPNLVESLEKQAYNKNGEPDKSSGLDHILDATGYMVVYRYPIVKRTASVTPLSM